MIVLWSSDSELYDWTGWARAWARDSRWSLAANARLIAFCFITSHSAHHCLCASAAAAASASSLRTFSAASACSLRSFSLAQALLLRHCSSRLFNQGSCGRVSNVFQTSQRAYLTPCSPKFFPTRMTQRQMLRSSSAVRAIVAGDLSMSNVLPTRGNSPPGRWSQ